MTGALNTKESADYLAVSFRTLENWRLKGGGPPYCKIGKCVRYRIIDLDQFLKSSLRASTSGR